MCFKMDKKEISTKRVVFYLLMQLSLAVLFVGMIIIERLFVVGVIIIVTYVLVTLSFLKRSNKT
jgi:hypothetical protein